MTLFHVISFHPLPSGCIQVCLSCTRISDKVPGKLGGAPTGDTRLLSNFPNIMLPEADSAQASRRCSSEFSTRSRVFQKSPDYMFRICQFTIFSSQISTCHLLLSAFFTGNCTERHETSFGFMLEQATQRHRHLSTMFHVTTQHRGKQHTH